jgi:MYXO-CTERM domain-containing protein
MRTAAVFFLLSASTFFACAAHNQDDSADSSSDVTAATTVFQAKAGKRLHPMGHLVDGRTIVTHWKDSQTGECVLQATVAGEVRCLPRQRGSTVFFDSACRQQGVQITSRPNPADTSKFATTEAGTVAIGAEVKNPPTVYMFDGTSCSLVPTASSSYFEAVPVLSTTFAAGKVAPVDIDKTIARQVWTGEDGAIGELPTSIEKTRNEQCALQFLTSGIVCLPTQTASDHAAFSDNTCTTEVAISTVVPAPKTAMSATDQCAPSYVELGAEVKTGAFEKDDLACVAFEGTLDNEHFFARGKALPLASFPSVKVAPGVLTNGLGSADLGSAGGGKLSPMLFDGKSLCAEQRLDDGKLHCVPLNAQTSPAGFGDAACTKPVALAKAACQSDVVIVQDGAKQTAFKSAGPHTGDVFMRDSTGACVKLPDGTPATTDLTPVVLPLVAEPVDLAPTTPTTPAPGPSGTGTTTTPAPTTTGTTAGPSTAPTGTSTTAPGSTTTTPGSTSADELPSQAPARTSSGRKSSSSSSSEPSSSGATEQPVKITDASSPPESSGCSSTGHSGSSNAGAPLLALAVALVLRRRRVTAKA